MIRKFILLSLSFLLVACGTSNRQAIPPTLAADEVTTWHYICEDTIGLDVEYANMGGEYSAKVYNEDVPKRVLPKIAEWQFASNGWEWSQEDPTTFKLTHNGEMIAHDCRSYNRVDNSGIVLLR